MFDKQLKIKMFRWLILPLRTVSLSFPPGNDKETVLSGKINHRNILIFNCLSNIDNLWISPHDPLPRRVAHAHLAHAPAGEDGQGEGSVRPVQQRQRGGPRGPAADG